MHIPVPAATARIRAQLSNAERKADDALIATSELMVTMLKARANPEVPVHTGQLALIRLMNAQKALLNGSSEIFRCHDAVGTVARELLILDEPGLTTGSGLETPEIAALAA